MDQEARKSIKISVIIILFLLLVSILSTYAGNSSADGSPTKLNTTYPSKIGYMYGWGDKQHLIKEDLVIEALPDGLLLEGLISLLDNNLLELPSTNINLHEKFNPYVNYYYLNKIAFIKINGRWIPYAIVGSRQAALSRVEIYDDVGQILTYSSNEILNIIDKKPHFNDDNWIINKAIENYENDEGIYSNIYGSVFRFSYELPNIR